MKHFLELVARAYVKQQEVELGDCCFVFPNRRSAIFFSKYLGQEAGKPVFSPKILTINDLMTDLSGLRPVDKISALYGLYKAYADLKWPGQTPVERFDDFVYWGDVFLGDFDDVDKYLVDARSLFTTINDLKEIDAGYEFLSPEQKKAIADFWRSVIDHYEGAESDKRTPFRTTWSVLYQLYCSFRESLEKEGLGYEGMIYRRVAEMLKGEGAEKDAMEARLGRYKRIVFVGLNALNACEKVLLNIIRDHLDGDFYWDFEDKRTKDPSNKSSLFLRENVKNYPSKYQLEASLPAKQEFRTISVSSGVAQSFVAGDILRELACEQDFDPFETAVVLPDERLLLPMLGAIPGEIEQINVTMGFPLAQSNAATFISFLERLHRNKKVTDDGRCSFYHRDVVSLLNHPFLSDEKAAKDLVARITAQNLIYVEDADLKEGLLGLVFRDVKELSDLPAYQIAILDAVEGKLSRVDREFVYHLRAAVTRLQSLAIPVAEESTYYKLLGQLLSVISIPFRGEPLAGLQVMGPLETRALDFKNVIILSVNEGVFPRRTVSNSFIPYNLRLGFGLPNYEFQDALSSYYFYRSIARAEKVFLLYDARTEGLQTGEPSRFIKQLKYHYDEELNFSEAPIVLGSNEQETPSIVKAKTPEVMKILHQRYLEKDARGYRKPFSASALNTYLDCPVRFYYQYVERVAEAEEVTEELDAGLFGSIFHYVMEMLYKPFVGQELSAQHIRAMAEDEKRIRALIMAGFAEKARIHSLRGRNLILNELLLNYVKKVLEHDAEVAPFILKGTEANGFATLALEGGRSVDLTGVIDRKDLRNGKPCIIDYKTGSLGGKIKADLDRMFEREGKDRPTISLQLFLYALLAQAEDPTLDIKDLSLCIHGLLEVFKQDYVLIEQKISEPLLDEFKERLKELIEEILNPAIPFEAKDPKCDYCNYKLLCNK